MTYLLSNWVSAGSENFLTRHGVEEKHHQNEGDHRKRVRMNASRERVPLREFGKVSIDVFQGASENCDHDARDCTARNITGRAQNTWAPVGIRRELILGEFARA